MAKKYRVGFKTVNAKLVVTKKHLNKIKKHVTRKDQKVIAAQIKAIDVLLSACASSGSRVASIVPRMSAVYTGSGN